MKQPLQKMKDEKAAEDQRAYLSYSFSRSTGRRKAEHEQGKRLKTIWNR
ncbi:hypothetical protein PR003_g18745 [Phytophthora rubi]|uniref:Uncharacterized protein n=2 Tax=Phytophthora TaxID=4783 RepID=A0A6A4EBG2_9STRA|nr:hypothetical protein PR002_g18205 [Phytophthora rubi]KAE9047758.1 hypothetical protein PR001_g4083 [Phytophthora rubi]KAE9316362.1 hypothetical protein PR003_g18745 [Phytophthora rubi]KAE9350521.1 hypothetical protein PF008_g6404 [Phytophthora fragariae]